MRDKLAGEGVTMDPATGGADQGQRWTPEDWANVDEARSSEPRRPSVNRTVD